MSLNKLSFIAEIGSNWVLENDPHNSRYEILRHIATAKDANANIAKVQIFTADTLYSKERAPDLWKKIRNFEFPLSFLSECLSFSNQTGIEFWASIFNPNLVHQCEVYLSGLKIASGDITYYDLVSEMAHWASKSNKPIALSTGAATREEIETALDIIEKYNPPKIILFHCVSSYPAEEIEMNLRSGLIYKDRVSEIGLSDHTMFSRAAMIAAALGYTYFEKHFRSHGATRYSPDYFVSASPQRFQTYVKDVILAKEIAGDGVKKVYPSEIAERVMARRGSDGLRPNNYKGG